MILFIHLPLVEQSAKRHEPDLTLCSSQQGHAVKEQPGKQLLVACPVYAFFDGSGSLSTKRFVPLNIDSIIESL